MNPTPSVAWRANVRDNARGVVVTIVNTTTSNLVLRNHELSSGHWAEVPPSVIANGATVQFGAVSSGWLTPSCEGTVEYETAHRGRVVVRWNNPFGFWHGDEFRVSQAAPALCKAKSARQSHAKGYLLDCRCAISLGDNTKSSSSSSLPTTTSSSSSSSSTPGGPSSPPSLSVPSTSSAPSSPGQKKTTRPPSPVLSPAPPTIRASAPLSSGTWWRERLLRFSRSMCVTIVNATDVVLTLETHDCGLDSMWAVEPRPEIGPGGMRDSFATASLGVAGTSGTLMWTIEGCERPLLLIWENPYFGTHMQKIQCPDQFTATVHVTERCCTGMLVVFSRKMGAIESLIRSVDDGGNKQRVPDMSEMDWITAVEMSKPKPDVTDGPKGSCVKFLSLSCTLMPFALNTGLQEPLYRSEQLAKVLSHAPYDMIALQEVFWAQSRKILKTALSHSYPHIIDGAGKEAFGVGVQSGLFFASKHPIEWSQFCPFEQGIGSDSLASKGALLVKVRISSANVVYVLITELQSDPDGSIPWKLVGNSKNRAVQVRHDQMQMIANMVKQVIKEKENDSSHCALLLAGNLHFSVERKIRNEQEAWTTDSLIPHLADLLNSNKFSVVYASELLQELSARGFQMRFLGQLRGATSDSRMRSLLLVIMIARVLRRELWIKMRESQFNSKEEEHQKFVDMCLLYYEAIMGFKRPPPPQEATVVVPAATNELAKHESGDLSSLDTPEGLRVVQQKPSLLQNIWDKELLKQITELFGPDSLGHDETTGSYLKAEVMWFQLLRFMQEQVGVILGDETELDLLNHEPRLLEYPADVEKVDSEFLKESEVSQDDEKLKIEPTSEFSEMLKVLGGPRDVFREANPKDFGSDVTAAVGHMLNVEEGRREIVLAFDKLPDGTKLLHLDSGHAARVMLMGESGAVSDMLTFAPGVEAVLNIGAVDGFVLME